MPDDNGEKKMVDNNEAHREGVNAVGFDLASFMAAM
jgi:hypothetical protein